MIEQVEAEGVGAVESPEQLVVEQALREQLRVEQALQDQLQRELFASHQREGAARTQLERWARQRVVPGYVEGLRVAAAQRGLMDDYRIQDENDLLCVVEANAPASWRRTHVWGDLPPDRRGLIAAFHPQCLLQPDWVGWINRIAEGVARSTGQVVFHIMASNSGWNLLLFGFSVTEPLAQASGVEPGSVWYDDQVEEGCDHDQYIARYDPDGSWHLLGVS